MGKILPSTGGGVDTSTDTVAADKMRAGITAHNAAGVQITGTIADATESSPVTTNKTLSLAGKFCPNDIVVNVPQGSDTSSDTVAADKMRSGITAHNAAGVQITGTIADATESSPVTANKTLSLAGKFCPNDIVVNVPQGVTLPDEINGIDGGSFTPSSDTVANTVTFNHSLGAVPKMFITWASPLTDLDRYTDPTNNALIYGIMMNRSLETSSTLTKDGHSLVVARLINMTLSFQNTAINSGSLSTYFTNTTVKLNSAYYYYQGATYSWLVIY